MSPGYLRDQNIELADKRVGPLQAQGKTVVFVLVDGKLKGAIALADIVRPEAKQAIAALKALDIRCLMLTGDNKATAKWVSDQIGLDEENCLEFARKMAQNVAEIRALIGWLLAQGCPSVGLLSVSFGGWAAGLIACSDARIAAVVLTPPAVAFRMFSSSPVVWRRVRETLQALRPAQEAMDTTRLNLILSTPVIPKENILLIEGLHDLFGDPQLIEELWQKWEQPEIWRLPHGHISMLFMPGLTGRVLRWLSPRLNLQPQLQSVHSALP